MRRRVPASVVVLAAVLIVATVSAFTLSGHDPVPPAGGPSGPTATTWSSITATADGQHVRLWMWGGEAALNDYVDRQVVPAAASAGVVLERVPIDDTASALSRLVAGARAGGDLSWVNGKNLDQGKAAGLWRASWVPSLPNARQFPTMRAVDNVAYPLRVRGVPWGRHRAAAAERLAEVGLADRARAVVTAPATPVVAALLGLDGAGIRPSARPLPRSASGAGGGR